MICMSKKPANKWSKFRFYFGIILIIFATVMFIITAPSTEKSLPDRSIHPVTAFESSYNNSEWHYVDLQSEERYLTGHVCNATFVNLSLNKIKEIEKDKILVLYDWDGNATLNKLADVVSGWGFKTVYYLRGGFLGWKHAGIGWCIWSDIE